jgi:formylglycine-generating enzyme required for sulfatase activity
MVEIPAGEFVMGSTQDDIAALSDSPNIDWYRRESPQHTVSLPTFGIGRFPVTVREYAAFFEAGGYQEPYFWSKVGWEWRTRYRIEAPEYWGEEEWTSDDSLPVVGVSWYEAYAYCKWLQSLTGKPYRLPDETEWEKAVRGTDGRVYPWGSRWDEHNANVCLNGEYNRWDRGGLRPHKRKDRDGSTTPVDAFPGGESPYRVMDAAGNTWEWCSNLLYDYFLYRLRPASPDNQDPCVVRGGSWYHDRYDARCASRYVYYPDCRDNVVGFRVAL